jgi:UDP-glucose 4-epimerase
MSMKIIVTGGAGFIGSHIVDAYIAAGHDVVVVDNLLTGFRRNINPKAKFYKADIRDRKAMDRIFKKERPAVLSHHAAIVEVVKSLRDPITTLDVNVLGMTNALAAFGEYGSGKRRKVLFSSSCAVYGTPKHVPTPETEPIDPQSPYGLSKLLGEEILKFYAGRHGFKYTIFRYANIYGPRQDPKGESGVTAVFGGLMKAKKRPMIFGDGSMARDYVFVGDIVRANILALKKGDNEIINLGHGTTITVRGVYDAVARATRFTEEPIYAPARSGEAYRVALRPEKARKRLGWRPLVTFEQGVRKTIAALA